MLLATLFKPQAPLTSAGAGRPTSGAKG